MMIFLELAEDLELLLRAGSGCWFEGAGLLGKLVDSSVQISCHTNYYC